MQRENQKDRSIVCKYDPTEPGDYRIEIRWSGEHVPGSPFNVMIFDTQEELGRFVQVLDKVINIFFKHFITICSFLTFYREATHHNKATTMLVVNSMVVVWDIPLALDK
jgi:hypothetical protein